MNTSFIFYNKLFSKYDNFHLGISRWDFLFAIILIITYLVVELLDNDYKEKYIQLKEFWINKRWLRLLVYYAMIIIISIYLSGNETFIYQMF